MQVYLGIGSNIDPQVNIDAGLAALAQLLDVQSISPCYRSPAMGFDGPDFMNLVIAANTDLTLSELNTALKKLERDFGRAPDAQKFSSRALDVDILLADPQVDEGMGEVEGIHLPRPDIYQYAFVLKPLLDIAPQLRCPQSDRLLADFLPDVADQALIQITQSADLPESA